MKQSEVRSDEPGLVYEISVMPGSGVLLYIGSAQDAEKLFKLVKLN